MIAWRVLLLVWLAAATMMTFGWLWQRRTNNASIVDVLWSAGLSLSAVVNALLGTGATATRLLVALLAGVWGARLAVHLWIRTRKAPEDGRYQALRVHWQKSADHGQLRWFALFQFQALLIVLFSIPFAAAAANNSQRPLAMVLALAIWILSVAGESLADHQLARFRVRPENRNKTCQCGLWRYSRHPNYFFEWLHWFTYVALAMGSATVWVAMSGPILMYIFLRWISGVPHTEAQALRTRGEEYRQYQRVTSMLIPWWPRQI